MLEPIFNISVETSEVNYGKFVYEPLHTSFGNSLGNALRRTLLASLEGAAISYVKFDKAPHFFTTIPGVKESVLDIVLNLKQVRFKYASQGPFTVKLSAKGAKKIYAKDITGEVEVVNGDQYIAEVTDAKGELEFEAIVDVGYGYQPSEEKEAKTGFIAIDSSYSPVTKVNFKIEEARVGRKSNYDRLIIEVWTNGSMSPEEAMKETAQILMNHFKNIFEGKSATSQTDEDEAALALEKKNPKVYETIIDELNLPSRVINALLRENIETVADLIQRGREDLSNLKGVGKKSIDLIEEELKKMEVELK